MVVLKMEFLVRIGMSGAIRRNCGAWEINGKVLGEGKGWKSFMMDFWVLVYWPLSWFHWANYTECWVRMFGVKRSAILSRQW